MLRLAAPFLAAATALSDETSLMQGIKPQQVSPKAEKEDKSKAIANLLQSATSMLKNGATPDVVDFAQATLTEITTIVLPAIEEAHAADQTLIDETFAMFEAALAELEAANNRVATASAAERDLSRRHKACREAEEMICGHKRRCDYDLWEIWRRFVEEESEMRQYSEEISSHFCVEGANGTMWIFRDHAITLFPPWLEQKPIVEHWEHEYDIKVPECEEWFITLDDKTAECDALQLQLERAACTHYNLVIEVRNNFADAWAYAMVTYQRIMFEVHCLEIDRWKEWRTLSTVQCLLDRTTERNGRPCDETTDEIVTEVATCERVQVDESIDHLRITYYIMPPFPPPCAMPPWDVVPEVHPWPGRCVPEPPAKPCNADWVAQEYAELWIPPQPIFSETNSHCNQRAECEVCTPAPVIPICYSLYEHQQGTSSLGLDYPTPEHLCSTATFSQMFEGMFDYNGDGHFTPGVWTVDDDGISHFTPSEQA